MLLNLIKSKLITLSIFFTSIFLPITLLFSNSIQIERFTQITGLCPSMIYWASCLGLLLCPFIYIFESEIQDELRLPGTTKFLGLLLYLILYITVLNKLTPDQIERINKGNLPFIIMILSIMTLFSVLIYVSSSYHNSQAITTRHIRLSIIFLGLILLGVVTIYFISAPHYMLIDLPDEPWSSSMAVAFMKNHDLAQDLIAFEYHPLNSHYYKYMGMGIQYLGASFETMRFFAVSIGIISTLFLGLGLIIYWGEEKKYNIAIVGMILVMIHPTFLRMSHNLRPDIFMSLHTSLLVISLVFYQRSRKRIYLFLSGLSMYIGLESVIYPSVLIAFILGMSLVIDWIIRPNQLNFRKVLYYLFGTMLAFLLYFMFHYFPNITYNLTITSQVSTRYTSSLGWRPLALLYYHLPVYNAVSPLYAITMFLGLFIAIWKERGLVRRIAVVTLLSSCLLFTTSIISVGYTSVIAPLVAFSISGLVRHRSILFITTMVIIPISVTILVQDLNWAIKHKVNQLTLQELQLIDWRIPEASRILVDDPTFFFVYFEKSDILWREALNQSSYAINHPNATEEDVFHALEIDYIICEDKTKLCDLAERVFPHDPIEFKTTLHTYWFY